MEAIPAIFISQCQVGSTSYQRLDDIEVQLGTW